MSNGSEQRLGRASPSVGCHSHLAYRLPLDLCSTNDHNYISIDKKLPPLLPNAFANKTGRVFPETAQLVDVIQAAVGDDAPVRCEPTVRMDMIL